MSKRSEKLKAIRNLLRKHASLMKSGTTHAMNEAEVALKLAHKLMLKWSIEEHQVKVDDEQRYQLLHMFVRFKGEGRTENVAWRRSFWCNLSKLFMTSGFWQGTELLVAVGHEDNLQAFGYAYLHVMNELKIACKVALAEAKQVGVVGLPKYRYLSEYDAHLPAHKRRRVLVHKAITPAQFQLSFYRSALHAMSSRIHEMMRENEQSVEQEANAAGNSVMAIIVSDAEDRRTAAEQMLNRGKKIRHVKQKLHGRRESEIAAMAGYQAGMTVNLNARRELK